MVGTLNMDDRYGRKKSPFRAVPILIFLALLAWLIWSATFHSNPEMRATLISFKEANPKSMVINFEIVRSNPKQAILCTLTATDYDQYVVGEIQYRIPAGAKREVISTAIPTRSHSVSAGVNRCIRAP